MISLLLPNLRGGGAERAMIDLGREFAASGHEVEFVLMDDVGEFLAETRRDFSVVGLAATRVRHIPRRLARYLRLRRPAALIANMWPLTSAAVIARAMSGHSCSLMLVDHAQLSRQYENHGKFSKLIIRASMTATYRFADHVAAVSDGAAQDAADLAGLPRSRVVTLQNPIPKRPDPSPEARSAAENCWGRGLVKRILAVGSFKPVKNHKLLLQAFALMQDKNARLMLLGQGQNEVALRELAIELGVAERVIFAGFQIDPAPFYASADLFVLSSDHEGFGNVIVEALSFGVPVVSTNCPSGPAEILQNGKFGRLVPVGDVSALACAMHNELNTQMDRDSLKQRASDFAPEVAAKKYLELLSIG